MAYLDVLCSHLWLVPEEQLRCLDNEDDFPDAPKIGDKSLPEAVKVVYAHLRSINEVQERLQFAAHLYTCLAVMGVIRRWVIYRIDQKKEHDVVVYDILLRMRQRRVYGCFAKTTPTLCCTCLIVPDEVRSRDFKPYFFVVWHEKPCVAIHEASEGPPPLLQNSLRRTLGSRPESFRCGVYEDLTSAHFGVLQLFP